MIKKTGKDIGRCREGVGGGTANEVGYNIHAYTHTPSSTHNKIPFGGEIFTLIVTNSPQPRPFKGRKKGLGAGFRNHSLVRRSEGGIKMGGRKMI